MAPPKPDDANLKFLFTCFTSAVSNGGKVDMKAVAEVHQINTKAASMRLTRLKKVLGSVTERNEADDEGGNAVDGGLPKTPKTPKSKIFKTKSVGTLTTNGSELDFSTPTPVAKVKSKNKKRKLNEEEQIDGLIQRAGIEAPSSGNVHSQAEIGQIRDVMLQTKDEDLQAEYERKIPKFEGKLA